MIWCFVILYFDFFCLYFSFSTST